MRTTTAYRMTQQTPPQQMAMSPPIALHSRLGQGRVTTEGLASSHSWDTSDHSIVLVLLNSTQRGTISYIYQVFINRSVPIYLYIVCYLSQFSKCRNVKHRSIQYLVLRDARSCGSGGSGEKTHSHTRTI